MGGWEVVGKNISIALWKGGGPHKSEACRWWGGGKTVTTPHPPIRPAWKYINTLSSTPSITKVTCIVHRFSSVFFCLAH